MQVALADREEVKGQSRWVFFDRSWVDAASALEHAVDEPVLEPLGSVHRYYSKVFFTPPWPEIFHSDPERRHGLSEAIAEHERLERAYARLGYRVVVLPKASVEARANAVLAELASTT